ncbi:cysteine hydrolase [Candidatus Woesearchaeota archaeon]|nr:cysteine hydrolase [Candidatus Woesearchaeota archaeon]
MLDPATTALIVVDIQNDFCHPDGKMAKAGHSLGWLQGTVSRMPAFIGSLRARGVAIIFLRYVYDPETASDYGREKLEARGIPGLCMKGSWGSEIYALRPADGDTIIDKHGFSGFYRTGLDGLLKGEGIGDVIVIGTSTHLCVQATVVDAYQRGYGVFLVEDLVATRDGERSLAEAAAETMRRHLATGVASADVLSLFRS